uniref:DUF4220 domain-containing protein n=2 Tax=Bursaphelenchus xylophilus TaxID=6326 RepID=A0A1I7SJD5_BURXY
MHWELAWLGFSISAVSCMGCSLWLIGLHKYNIARTKDRLSMKTLSARFQQTENENSNKSIAPSIIGYMILAFIGMFLSEVRRRIVVANGKETPASELVTRIGYMVVDCYAVYHMTCFMYFNNAMRSLVRQDIARFFGAKTADYCCSLESVHPESQALQTEAYFNQFKSAWG